MAPVQRQAIHAALEQALDAGAAVLERGGAALDAVQAAVVALEEAPWFNAGYGAVYTARGEHELDAALMEGAVMDHSPHVLLAGQGAERFADTQPAIARVDNAWFDTPSRLAQLHRAQEEAREGASAAGRYFGTVGAVALDRQGHLAAATSTGGMTNKRWGRVGDSPLIGAGTWADQRVAVSATGWGEAFIRCAAAHDIAARVAHGGASLGEAAEAVVFGTLPALGGDGGVIAVDAQGRLALPFNTGGMYRGWIDRDGRRGTAIFDA
ncbi:isoaspartyl peptidase/L-asparaginase [Pseudoxanthomonas winnipegensis]|uniref:Isoaspartyl peptidase n=2 Tax=Pseudoxanthomonas winnipegensis TaxID=2480810 RepID=A0A4V6MKR9_9GAMM|nr:isoaspartyl peptidase/L-asparaginase [Pseudoxanthomonas winnipegensis]